MVWKAVFFTMFLSLPSFADRVPALDALHNGLSKYKNENPVVIMSAGDDHLLVHCEALKVKIPIQN